MRRMPQKYLDFSWSQSNIKWIRSWRQPLKLKCLLLVKEWTTFIVWHVDRFWINYDLCWIDYVRLEFLKEKATKASTAVLDNRCRKAAVIFERHNIARKFLLWNLKQGSRKIFFNESAIKCFPWAVAVLDCGLGHFCVSSPLLWQQSLMTLSSKLCKLKSVLLLPCMRSASAMQSVLCWKCRLIAINLRPICVWRVQSKAELPGDGAVPSFQTPRPLHPGQHIRP